MPHTFQHTAARRRLQVARLALPAMVGFNTQPPEGGCFHRAGCKLSTKVSTHSRPKAADSIFFALHK